MWQTLLALITSIVIFHTSLPRGGLADRYFLGLFAAVLLLAMSCLSLIIRGSSISFLKTGPRTTILVGLLGASFLYFQFGFVRSESSGFQQTAARIANEAKPRVILVCGDPIAEGVVVSEIALRDQRLRHFILRASKVLAQSDWNGDDYQPLFSNPQQVAAYLDSVPVDYVLIDDPDRHRTVLHHLLLLDAIALQPKVWRLAGWAGNTLQLWERSSPLTHGDPTIRIDMKYSLQRSLSNN
jgi:hypothetical protein